MKKQIGSPRSTETQFKCFILVPIAKNQYVRGIPDALKINCFSIVPIKKTLHLEIFFIVNKQMGSRTTTENQFFYCITATNTKSQCIWELPDALKISCSSIVPIKKSLHLEIFNFDEETNRESQASEDI